MEQLIKVSKNTKGENVVSARELHSFLGATERFSSWMERNFQYGFVENQDYSGCKHFNALANQLLDDFVLTIDCAKEIAMIQRTDKGKVARQYFIECEKQLKEVKKSSYQIEDPIERAKVWIEEQERSKLLLQQASDKIEQDKQKVVFADSVIGSSTSILIRQFAKDLCDQNFEIGQNRLFQWFRENKYINDNNEPYQEYVSQGYFEVITRAIGSGTDTFTVKTTKLTGKGQVYFAKKIKC